MTRSTCDQCGERIREPDTTDQHAITCPRSIHYVAVRPFDDQKASPGRRLRIQQDEPSDVVTLADEHTLPERVMRTDVHRRMIHESLLLTIDEAAWTRDRLIELTRGDMVYVVLTKEQWDGVLSDLHSCDECTHPELRRQVKA